MEIGISSDIAIVAIGRNEWPRLVLCLESAKPHSGRIVYVDSGSKDGSAEGSRRLGAEVVELEPDRPFTAARGRNAGFTRALQLEPDLELVQFVDGDCELAPSWLGEAAAYLDAHPEVAAVAGRRRERDPEASLYNQLADIEWAMEAGKHSAFGGDVLIRASVLLQMGGYDENLVAGEDRDLAFRIRQAGRPVAHLDREMTCHDIDMHHFGAFWSRQVRSGRAYAEQLALHGRRDAASFRSVCSILLWGGVLPMLALGGESVPFGASLLSFYAILWARVYQHELRRSARADLGLLYASACVVGKFAGLCGLLSFIWARWKPRHPAAANGFIKTGPSPAQGVGSSGIRGIAR